MKQIAKWTLLCVLVTAVGFGATLLAGHPDRIARTLAAMLAPAPVASTQADVEVLPEAEAAVSDVVDFAADTATGTLAAAGAPAPAPQLQPELGALTAVGTVELTQPRQVVLEAGGQIETIAVEEGDVVSAGDLLIALDTTYLDWAVEQAEISFEAARIDFEALGDVEESDIAVAEANLLMAQENLAEVQRGPTEEALAAAESEVAAAWAAHAELLEQPTQAQINQALANLRKAEIAVQAAQREYDKIAWLPEAAATSAADTLQQATIDLEAARAAFEEANKPATEAQLQSAVAAARRAEAALNELRKQPTAAQLASAQAQVASAEAALEDARRGAEESDLQKAELAVRQAMIALEEARLARQNAEVTAPIDGTILTVDVELGQQASAGTVVATMADTANVNLVVNVEQKDISQVRVGQPVVISIYALPNDTFFGVVDKIAPIADAGTGFVTFPVVIRLTEGPLDLILPGMTASAAFGVDEVPEPEAAEPEATAEATEEPAEEAPSAPTPTATTEPEEEAAPETETIPEAGDTPDAEATPEPEEEAETSGTDAAADAEPDATPTVSN